MVAVLLVRRERVPGEEHVGAAGADHTHAPFAELVQRRLAKTAVFVAQELDLGVDAQDGGASASFLASRLRRKALVPGRIECALLVVRRDDLVDLVAQAGHPGDRAAGHELHVVGVRDDDEHLLSHAILRRSPSAMASPQPTGSVMSAMAEPASE